MLTKTLTLRLFLLLTSLLQMAIKRVVFSCTRLLQDLFREKLTRLIEINLDIWVLLLSLLFNVVLSDVVHMQLHIRVD